MDNWHLACCTGHQKGLLPTLHEIACRCCYTGLRLAETQALLSTFRIYGFAAVRFGLQALKQVREKAQEICKLPQNLGQVVNISIDMVVPKKSLNPKSIWKCQSSKRHCM